MARRRIISASKSTISAETRKAFQIEGLDEILARLSKIMDGMTGKEAKTVYYHAGILLKNQMVANAPYDPGRKKGIHLRDAIFCGRGDENKPHVLVGVNYKKAPHAWLVEYGSHRWQGKPYVRPAITQTGSRIGSTIKEGLIAIIEKHAK